MANIKKHDDDDDVSSKLINQGSYGCIYYPSLPFTLQKKHHPTRHENRERQLYVSKLQKHNFHSEFEDYIGKKIQEIPSFDIFFIPVLSTYKIDLATIKQSYVTDCDAISKYIRRNNVSKDDIASKDYQALNKKFIMQKMKYINGTSLHHHLLEVVMKRTRSGSGRTRRSGSGSGNGRDSGRGRGRDSGSGSGSGSDSGRDSGSGSGSGSESDHDDSHVSKTLRKDERQIKKYRREFKQDETVSSYKLMSIAFDLYERIMDSIQLLIKYKIVHYDLKENNILVEKIQQLPYIIDFGLSIDIERLLTYKWSDKGEDNSKSKSSQQTIINSEVLYSSGSSKILKDNYLWKQHFYIHAPDYFLWPIEVHLMTYLINEHSTLTDESLRKICYDYVANNRAIEYMSRDFKKKIFEISVATFSRFIHQPREKVLNELVKYWDKWDMYAINIMFLKIMYELIFHREAVGADEDTRRPDSFESASASLNEERQHKLDPHYSPETEIVFKNKYKIKPKQKYNSTKIMNTIQVMLRNIHPNPDKRMTPQETKTFFVSIFYEC